MKKILTIALAAATLAGGAVAVASPADAAPRHHGYSGHHGSYGHGYRGHRGGYYRGHYGYRNHCWTTRQWSHRYHRMVRVTRCR